MSDPRYEERLSDPVNRRPDTDGGMWGWIAGIAVVVLIAIILIAGWNSNKNTASNAPSPAATTGSATAPISPPSTTGSGPSASPMTPSSPSAPSSPTPAPSKP